MTNAAENAPSLPKLRAAHAAWTAAHAKVSRLAINDRRYAGAVKALEARRREMLRLVDVVVAETR